METTVKLQPLFSYSTWPIIVIGALIFIFTIYLIIDAIRNRKQEPISEELKIVEPKNINSIKNKYLKRIDALALKVNQGKISLRGSYQELSSIIRFFIYEATDIKVQNYTLSDIERIGMPVLTELIQEYYAPEFAKQSIGNIKQSIEKTRKVVEKWN